MGGLPPGSPPIADSVPYAGGAAVRTPRVRDVLAIASGIAAMGVALLLAPGPVLGAALILALAWPLARWRGDRHRLSRRRIATTVLVALALWTGIWIVAAVSDFSLGDVAADDAPAAAGGDASWVDGVERAYAAGVVAVLSWGAAGYGLRGLRRHRKHGRHGSSPEDVAAPGPAGAA